MKPVIVTALIINITRNSVMMTGKKVIIFCKSSHSERIIFATTAWLGKKKKLDLSISYGSSLFFGYILFFSCMVIYDS